MRHWHISARIGSFSDHYGVYKDEATARKAMRAQAKSHGGRVVNAGRDRRVRIGDKEIYYTVVQSP